jgi:hypothetical protein
MMKKMATTTPRRGEVWLVDLGMVAKIRPCLVVSIPANDENDRVLTTLIPHTTSTRGSRFEIAIASRFLKTGAFDVQKPSCQCGIGDLVAASLGPAGMKPTEAKKSSIAAR